MKLRKSLYLLLLVAAMTVSVGVRPAHAEEDNNGMWVKLGRGIANTVTGYLEIPTRMEEIQEQGNRWPIAILGGAAKGLFYGTTRTLVGIYEVVTFPFPIPANYRVIMKPEYILPDE